MFVGHCPASKAYRLIPLDDVTKVEKSRDVVFNEAVMASKNKKPKRRREITWASEKQQTVASSTAETEYMACSAACQEIKWVLNFSELPTFSVDRPMVLWCDNQGAVLMSANEDQHKRSKHIDLRHHFIRDTLSGGLVKIKYIPKSEMIADIFTKSLTPEKFKVCREKLGLRSLPRRRSCASGGVGSLRMSKIEAASFFQKRPYYGASSQREIQLETSSFRLSVACSISVLALEPNREIFRPQIRDFILCGDVLEVYLSSLELFTDEFLLHVHVFYSFEKPRAFDQADCRDIVNLDCWDDLPSHVFEQI